MRIQLRISKETLIILEKEKSKYKIQNDANVTYGWIIKVIFQDIVPKKNHINWEYVKESPLPYTKKVVDDFNTTLNLEQSILNDIQEFQIFFKEHFHFSRVHKAYVIRMVLRAYCLELENINIYKG